MDEGQQPVWAVAALTVALGVAWASPGAAQDNTSSRISNAETEPYFFVPSLQGAFSLSPGLRARRVEHLNDSATLPTLDLTGRVGYRSYIDDWSRSMVSVWLGGSTSLGGTAGQGSLRTLSLGVDGELRWLNTQFLGLLANVTLEVGPAFWAAPSAAPDFGLNPEERLTASPLDDDLFGWRAEARVALGFGLMTSFMPYTFLENPISFGVERVELGEASWTAMTLGFELNFDMIHR